MASTHHLVLFKDALSWPWAPPRGSSRPRAALEPQNRASPPGNTGRTSAVAGAGRHEQPVCVDHMLEREHCQQAAFNGWRLTSPDSVTLANGGLVPFPPGGPLPRGRDGHGGSCSHPPRAAAASSVKLPASLSSSGKWAPEWGPNPGAACQED